MNGILFDMDGMLLENRDVWCESNRIALEEHNIELTPDEFVSVAGWKHLHLLLAEKGYKKSIIKSVTTRRNELAVELIPTHSHWRDGAENLLQWATEETNRTAIVTSTHRTLFNVLNDVFELTKKVNIVVTGDEVPNYKPDPSGLFLASRKLKIDPQRGVYLGDQLSDIQAATAAGMQSILCVGQLTPSDAKHKYVIDHLHHAPAVVESLLRV